MIIHILQAKRKLPNRTNKDTNGGYGTVNYFGDGLASRFLAKLKSKAMNFPELAPAYASAILKQQEHQVTYGDNEINARADITLLPTSIVHYNEELRQARELKQRYPAMRVGFFSGVCDTFGDRYASEFDFVIKGDFENVMLNVDPVHWEGVLEGGLDSDLDAIPFPDWAHIPAASRPNLVTKKMHSNLFPVLASRGCPMSCRYYCTYPLSQGVRHRKRSVESLTSEFEYLIKDHRMNLVMFRDPIFTLDMGRTEELCRSIIAHKLKFDWICETHPGYLNEDLLKLLSESGCRAVKLGIESGNKAVMNSAKREPQEFDAQFHVIRLCEKYNIRVLGFFILGYFEDTEETVLQTIEHAKWLNPYGAQFTVATPYPGTDWYNDLKKENDRYHLSENMEEYTQYELVYDHPNLDRKLMGKLKNKAYRSYYFRMPYIMKHHLRRSGR